MITPEKLILGERVRILDKVNNMGTIRKGVIKFIEKDNEIDDLFWVYIRDYDETKNNKTDPRFPWTYAEISHNTNEYLCLESECIKPEQITHIPIVDYDGDWRGV